MSSPSPPPDAPVPARRASKRASLSPPPDVPDATPAVPQPTTPTSASPDENDDIIDMETLNQILDLDEDDSHEFSRGMAWAYFDQAAETFRDMDDAFTAQDLPRLSSLGHFLKGSSAALGVTRVQASCEKIQHYGDLRDEEACLDLSTEKALENIDTTLERVKREYAAAEKWLKSFYDNLPIAAA